MIILEFLCRFIADRLPKKVVYYATIRLMAYGTGMKYPNTNVATVRAMTLLKRWEKELS